MAVTIRLDLENDQVEIGNEEIGFAKFDCAQKDFAWAQRFAEHLEEEGVEVDIEEKDDDDDEEPLPKKRRE